MEFKPESWYKEKDTTKMAKPGVKEGNCTIFAYYTIRTLGLDTVSLTKCGLNYY